MGVVSTPCVPGVLEDGEDEEELDEELDELEPVGACCACSVGASTRPVTRSANIANAISPCRETGNLNRWVFRIDQEAIRRFRDGEEQFRLNTIRIRRSLQV
jgi:hypothetical protein